jgi:hypothetical protein
MEPVNPAVHIGVDVGQKIDPTAIVVCEVSARDSGRREGGYVGRNYVDGVRAVRETVYTARLIERLPLGTSYPDVARRIVTIVEGVVGRVSWGQRPPSCRLWIDATGVGQPVVDIVKAELRGSRHASAASVYPMTFTYGDTYDKRTGRLGKAYLVSNLQALLQTGPIKLPPNHPDAEAMARELKDYQIKVDQDGADTYGAFKVGSHDDLATALGLAVLDDPMRSGVWSVPSRYG